MAKKCIYSEIILSHPDNKKSLPDVIMIYPEIITKLCRDTVDLVIFACLHFCEYLISGLFTKFTICEFSFFFSSAIMIRIVARSLNS